MPKWLDNVARAVQALKATPRPGELYPPQAGAPGPISWGGWPDLGGTGAGLSAVGGAGLSQSQRDEQRARTAIQSVWVYACAAAIAREISTAQVSLTTRTGDEEEQTDNSPFERLWEAPNAAMGRSYLMQFWAWNLLLSGEAYLYARPVNGQITELWPVPSWRIAPVPDPATFIKGYVFRNGQDGTPTLIPAQYICYTRLPNPFDVYRGLSPLAASAIAIDSDLSMARWNASFFSEENGVPSGLVSVPKDMLDQDIARVRMELRDFFGGANKRRVAVARAGDLSWQAFGHTQKEMEFLQGRAMTQKEIMYAFGIPEGYFSERANRANAEQARATMIENAVWPLLELLREDLNAQWGGKWWGEAERVTFADIRPRNLESELKELEAEKPIRTLDELRAMRKLDPIGDYRGAMLLSEIDKAMALPGTPASQEAEAAVAELEAAAAPEEVPALPGGGEPVAPEGMGEEPALEAEPGTEEAAKALDRQRWEAKALKALRAGKGAAVAFRPDALDDGEAQAIRAALEAAQDATAVKAAFKAVDVDDVWEGAVAWARLAMREEEA